MRGRFHVTAEAYPGDVAVKESVSQERRAYYLTGAWIALALVPVFFLLGFGAAHLPYLIWPYEEGSGQEPLWFGAITEIIFFGILAVPVVAAVWFGLRANRTGTRWGWLPIGLAGAVVLFFLVITVINVVAQVLGIEGP